MSTFYEFVVAWFALVTGLIGLTLIVLRMFTWAGMPLVLCGGSTCLYFAERVMTSPMQFTSSDLYIMGTVSLGPVITGLALLFLAGDEDK